MPSEHPAIRVENILECVPFAFVTDRKGHIIRLGRYLSRNHPYLAGQRYDEAFAVEQGKRALQNLIDCSGPIDARMLKERVELHLRTDDGLALVGSLLPLDGDAGGAVFIGTIAPSLISRVTDFGLTVSDFAPFDVAADLAMMAQVNDAALKDMRLLNEGLTTARDAAVAATKKMEMVALVDALSGLGNRAAFQRLEGGSSCDAVNPEEVTSLLLIDVDNFKPVNDHYGHAAGDELIHWIGKSISASLKDNASAYRLGGDEFAVLFNSMTPHQACQVASEIVQAISRTFIIGGRRIAVTASGGLASRMFGVNDVEGLYRAADIALHDAKRSGRAQLQTFTARLGRRELENKLLERDLFEAVDAEDFEIWVQPLFDLQTGELWGGEALVRWWNRRLDCHIPPDVFVPIAEQYGLISKIDLLVFSRIVAQRKAIGGKACRVCWSTNLSPITIRSPELRRSLRDILRKQGPLCVPLTIEITESAIGRETNRIRTTLRAIRQMGMELAIDDFGAGQTSLSLLNSLPITRLKLDRSLIEKIDTDERSEMIVCSIVKLAHELGLRVTAEGIERQSQADRLVHMGPMKAQGYLFARPMPLQEFVDYIEASDGTLSCEVVGKRSIS